MTTRLGSVALLVPDYEAALAFFAGVLGFRVAEDTPLDPPKRWVRVVPPDGGTGLLLARAATPAQAEAIGRQGGGRVFLFLETRAFEADHARLAAAGVAFEAPPRAEPYGRVVVFRDPFGNRWDLVERAAPVPRPMRVHVTGASGAGVSTLGRALAGAMAVPHHDTDDYYWLPTDPPYAQARPEAERVALMRALFLDRPAWVLSGSVGGWADAIVPRFEVVLFLTAPAAQRRARLMAREALRLGLSPEAAGARAETRAFLDWADAYDAGPATGRSRARHEAWLARCGAPVIRLDAGQPAAAVAEAALAALAAR